MRVSQLVEFDAFLGCKILQARENLFISRNNIAQITAEQILVEMLNLSAAFLGVPQPASIWCDFIGKQDGTIAGLAFFDFEIDQLHVNGFENVKQGIVHGTGLARNLRKLVLSGQSQGDNAVIIDERIAQII
ncbi:hypothetical protein BITS_1842 [Bifidobacterium tsurumiense]|uniref:Uncharacterized protein n=1 Tax=Bifidobacterium tsurumiense TaxID=356829 RepID=A0A087EE25_9BIFI|nr:hypothetical protein BITS_1842 [Bifidobacterium tsurumiense]